MRKIKSTRIRRLKRAYQYTRRILKSTVGKDFLISKDVRIPTTRLGQDQGEWVVADRLVSRESIVYSVGIGEDISFDLELMRRYGCRVYGWDPTPLAISFMERLETPPGFTLLPYGLGTEDCVKAFGGKTHGDRSFSSNSLSSSKIFVEVRRITSMMRLLNHDRVDILKMDIEGDEYEVIRQIVQDKIIIPQLLIEFHHRWTSRIPAEKTKEHVSMLRGAGYLIFDVSASGGEFSFVHKTALIKGRNHW
jgi:FkbM family methyltransferase